jgi:hypothetical protein
MFFYTVFGRHPSYMSIEITVNSVSCAAIFVDNQAAYTWSTGVAVFAVNQGDDCFMRTHSTYASARSVNSNDLMRISLSRVKID